MSTIATSGWCSRTSRISSDPSPAWPTTSYPRCSRRPTRPSRSKTSSSATITRVRLACSASAIPDSMRQDECCGRCGSSRRHGCAQWRPSSGRSRAPAPASSRARRGARSRASRRTVPWPTRRCSTARGQTAALRATRKPVPPRQTPGVRRSPAHPPRRSIGLPRSTPSIADSVPRIADEAFRVVTASAQPAQQPPPKLLCGSAHSSAARPRPVSSRRRKGAGCCALVRSQPAGGSWHRRAVTRIAVVYYSATGNVHRHALAEGARDDGAEVRLRHVEEISPEQLISQNQYWGRPRSEVEDEPVASLADLVWADGIAFGTPTRFGNVAAQLKIFLDLAGELWERGALVDKVATSFTSSMTEHGGQESTILALNNTLYHWGAIVLPLGYTVHEVFNGGGNPYGTSYTSDHRIDGPDEEALTVARGQGARLARVAAAIAAARGAGLLPTKATARTTSSNGKEN